MSPMRRTEKRDSTPTRSTTCRGWHINQRDISTREEPERVTLLSEGRLQRTFKCLCTLHSNNYMKDNFMIKIETWHKPDMGNQENVHGLDKSSWESVEIIDIDIADRSSISQKDYKPELDPAIYKSKKTGRGPLGPNWKEELVDNPNCPHMCAYKLVTVEFKWRGLQSKIENFIQKMEGRVFTHFHRQLFCLIDEWIDMSMDDIRHVEEETKKELDEMRIKDGIKGMSAAD
uniref:Phosphatidylinositol transfer protein alpha isoform n=1 Tax=Echeneis naucrates TaxID=173247 RepID=A0A665V7H1_ECHNA